MESKQEKIEMLQTAIKQLIDDEKRSFKDVLVADDDDDDDKEFDRRLLSKLLSQVETLRECDLLQEDTKTCHDNETQTNDFPDQPEKKAAMKEESSGGDEEEENREEEIIKEIRKVKKQNLITHCLLSVMFVLTLTWQLSEVSMILKLKNSLNNPIRSIGGLLTGILKGPPASAGNGKEEEKQQNGENNKVIETSLPGIKLPKLPQLDLPSLDFDRE